MADVFDVMVQPEDWREPYSNTGNTYKVFENDEIRLIAPPIVGGLAVLSLADVNAFTEDSNVNVISSECDLRCADAEVTWTPMAWVYRLPSVLHPNSSVACTTDCPRGMVVCKDPHLLGILGQHIIWYGADNKWYALFKDDIDDLHVNIRITTPEPDFPKHQFTTGMAVVVGEHSIVIEVKDSYSALTDGCPDGIVPCLADGGITIVVDGHGNYALLSLTRSEYVADGMELSAANLPPVCQEFGHKDVLASPKKGNMNVGRRLRALTFEDGVLSLANMLPTLCSELVTDHGLLDVQSQQSIFRVVTPTADIRLSPGIDHRKKRTKKNRRMVPELDMWQMEVGVNDLFLKHENVSVLLGETSRIVYDNDGHPIMEGLGALRGTVEDYHVSDALGTDFALLHKDIK